LRREDVAKILPARRNRPLVLVDIAVPRDIDPAVAELPNVFLYNIDDLEAVVRENTKNREQELARCREIIQHHVGKLMLRFAGRPAGEAVDAALGEPAVSFFQPVACSN
jgi:glutamyl-tRNA reductase